MAIASCWQATEAPAGQHPAQPGDTGHHQRRIRQRAKNDDGTDMFATQALPQHRGVLRANGHEEPEAQRRARGGNRPGF